MPRAGTRQLQLYMGIVLFYLFVVYICVLHVKYSARHASYTNPRQLTPTGLANTTMTYMRQLPGA